MRDPSEPHGQTATPPTASAPAPNGADGPVTIRTIADRVGVHPSTVSRALHGPSSPHNVRAQEIRKVAADLGYVPHTAAASLRTRRTLALGVTVSRITDVVMAILYESIERTARELGYQTLVSGTGDDPDKQRELIEFMLARRVDGLIVADAHRDGRQVSWLQERGVPFVLAIRHAGDHLSVTSDEYLGGRLAGTHLAELGHRRVAVLAGQPWSSAFSGRTAGCLAALHDHGVDVPDRRVVHGPVDVIGGWSQMKQVLDDDPDVTAVFAVNDDAALGASGALRERGRNPGVDVALVGYNDVPIAAAADLTTVCNPLEDIGAIATRVLIEQMTAGTARSVRLQPQLVLRGTSVSAA